MRLTMRLPILVAALLSSIVVPRWAQADDPAAVVELKEGYRLRQAGDCRAALPHLLASYRLDAEPKPILNAADCEQRMGDLVTARKHAAEGLTLAERANDTELAAVARDQLANIERHIARLTLARTGSSPVTVLLDGASVESFDAPILANPGTHSIVVRAEGHADRSYQVTLAEAETQRVELRAGEPLASPPSSTPVEPARASASVATRESPAPPTESTWSTRKTAALFLGGVGVVGVVVGSVFGANAISKNNSSNGSNHCDATGCDAIGKQLRNDALSAATASDWLIGLGLAAVAGGVVLYLTAPSASPTTARLELVPACARSSAGLGLRGAW